MLTIDSLLMKIKEVRKLCLYNLLTTIFSVCILILLEVNMIFLSALIYLFSLYLVCLFITNDTLHKYGLKRGTFDMDKKTFVSFFKKGTQLKLLLLSLLPTIITIWTIILLKSNHLSLSLHFFDFLFFMYMSVFFFYSIKEMINSFITTIFLTRIIHYACINNLIKK